MAQSQIRWIQSDYVTLGKAVSAFNKKVKELEAEEADVKLPQIRNYQDVKKDIHTRSELKNVINSMKRFLQDDAGETFTTKGGQNITKWEHQENIINTRKATRFINTQIKELEKPIAKGDYSRAQMGSQELRAWVATLHSIRKLELKRGFEYNRIKLRVDTLGKADYTYAKALIFRENFLKALEESKELEGYDLLMKKLRKYSNPISFYNQIRKSEVFMDIFLYYKEGSGLMYGSFSSEQERFNQGLEDLGIVDEEKQKAIKRTMRTDDEELKVMARSISSADDLFEFLNKEKRK